MNMHMMAAVVAAGMSAGAMAQLQPYGGLHVARNTTAATLGQRLLPNNEPRLSFVSATGSFLTDSPATSSGLYTAQNLYFAGSGTPGTLAQILNNYDLGESGVILSTGDVEEYETGLNDVSDETYEYEVDATTAQIALLESFDPGSGAYFYDATQLDVMIDSCSAQKVVFEFVFGSDEFAEYVSPGFTDIFGILVDGVPADFVAVNDDNFAYVAETELDGVEVRWDTPLIRVIASVPAGQSVVTFMISDVNDYAVDSTVYIEPMRSLADYNQDGSINFSDVSDYLNDWQAEDGRADLDGDGEFTEDDVDILVAEIDASCP